MRTLLAALVAVGCSPPPSGGIDPAPTPQDLRWPEHVGTCTDRDGATAVCLSFDDYAAVQAELARAQSWIRQASLVLREQCGVDPAEHGRVVAGPPVTAVR